MRPGRPMAFGKIADGGKTAFLFGLPGNPVAVMVTFYQFVRGRPAFHDPAAAERGNSAAVQALSSQADIRKKSRDAPNTSAASSNSSDGDAWKVRTTGQQGSGVLRSMSEANCFIVLAHEQGSVKAGDLVDVMLFDGLV